MQIRKLILRTTSLPHNKLVTLLLYGFINHDDNKHCVKSVHIRSFSSPYFPAFGLNTERYGVSLRIQSECEKIQTRYAFLLSDVVFVL